LGGAIHPAEEETLPEVAKRHNFGRRQAGRHHQAVGQQQAHRFLLPAGEARLVRDEQKKEEEEEEEEEERSCLTDLLLLLFVLRCVVLCDRSAAAVLIFRGPTSW
jgi:hypothetical protein